LALRILVVEDEMTIAFMIEDMLLDLGHEVVKVAMRLPEALKAAANLDFDLALLDVNLDGHLSFGVAEILTQRRIPFAFATGYGSAGLQQPFDSRPVLMKPFLRADLQRVLAATGRKGAAALPVS
jgi:CheY-like chemotaxis protein